MVKLPRKKVTYVIPNNDMNYGKDVPADQLPKVKVQEDNVCACPYCSGRFVAEGLKESPAPQPSNNSNILYFFLFIFHLIVLKPHIRQ